MLRTGAVVGLLTAAFATMGLLVPGPAHAEGSADLYPVDAACAPNSSGGSCRANIEWRTGTYGPAGGAQVRRRSLFQVYAATGEMILLGSSAVGVGAGDALVYDPGVVTDPDALTLPALTTGTNGFRCSDQRTASGIATQGRITTRAQELAGAQAVSGGGNPGGYVPCAYTAPATGLYTVVFYGPAGDGLNTDGGVTAETSLAAAGNFDATQGTSIAAWDVTIRANATATLDVEGRLLTKALVAFTGGNGRPVNTSFVLVTTDGFRYRTETRGLDPNGFVLYGNQQGFLDGDGSPLYHDVLGTSGGASMATVAGGVTFAAPTYPIFLNPPADATLAALGIPLSPTAPTMSGISFAGNVSGNTSSVAGGGTFSYTANMAGVYEIVISRDGVSFDPGASQNRVLRGVGSSGANAIAWDGLDNSGSPFPIGTGYPVRASLHAGEYHFPLIDAENSTLGGPTFTLLNPPGGVCPFGNPSCTTAFFDDRGYRTRGAAAADVGTPPPPDTPLCGGSPPAAPYRSDAVTGFDTSGTARAFGTDTGGNTNSSCTGSFGDVKGLDTWTYFPSSTQSATLNVVDTADLSVAKTAASTLVVGQAATYTLAVANAGPAASGAITLTDTLPAGLSYVSASGTGWSCGIAGQTVTCVHAAGLAATATTAVTLVVNVTPAAAPQVANTATVAGTVADAVPANNTSTATSPVTPVPIAVDDSGGTAPGTAVTLSVLVNDTLGVPPTTITGFTQPSQGTVSCSTTCTYTPAAGFTGTDTFTYTITDANARSSTATVTIVVSAAPAPSPPPPAGSSPTDIATTVTGPATAVAGSRVSLSGTLAHVAGAPAADATVVFALPAGFAPVAGSVTTTGGAGVSCTTAASSVTCRLSLLGVAEVVTVRWQATVGADVGPGVYDVASVGTTTTRDDVAANDRSTWAIRVTRPTQPTPRPKPAPRPVARPALAIELEPDRSSVLPGGTVRYRILVTNTGDGAAAPVLVCAAPPRDAVFAEPARGGLRGGDVCWVVRRLAAGRQRAFGFTVRFDGDARAGSAANAATAVVRSGRAGARAVTRASITVLGSPPRQRQGGVTG